MGFEVEMKFRGVDHAALAARLASLGAEASPPVDQVDCYLAHPARDFAVTNEALRLRRDGGTNRITYKGPKLGGPTKTREEVEITFEDGEGPYDGMTRLFEALGFRPVATIRKTRTEYALQVDGRYVHVGLDRAEGLGDFAEVEALAESAADLPEAQAVVQRLAAGLGLEAVEPRSYLRMHLEAARLIAPAAP